VVDRESPANGHTVAGLHDQNLAANYQSNDRWSVAADFDGLAGGPGRAFDIGVKLN